MYLEIFRSVHITFVVLTGEFPEREFAGDGFQWDTVLHGSNSRSLRSAALRSG
jgi:hypothetical protein